MRAGLYDQNRCTSFLCPYPSQVFMGLRRTFKVLTGRTTEVLHETFMLYSAPPFSWTYSMQNPEAFFGVLV